MPKKNKKKKNTSIRKKIYKKNNKENVPQTDVNMVSSKIIINEIDLEIEEFRNKINFESVNANLAKKIVPRFSEKWLSFIKSSAEN